MKRKRIEGLDCAAPAEQVIQHVLRAYVKALCGMRRKALDWNDPEGVHDMRVLSRRLRSAIRDFEPHVRKHALPIGKLRAIAKSLGGVRDEDVAIAALEKLKADAPTEVVKGIELLLEERRERQTDARETLKNRIDRAVISEFREEFESKVQNIALPQPRLTGQAPRDTRTFATLGFPIIAARMKELRAESPHIFIPGNNRDLHELRILAKRLRYSTEIFSSCWGEDLNGMAKEIALLQTSLGELHDCDVWIDDLGARLKKTARQARTDHHAQTLAACMWLLKHFAKQRTEHYCDALSRWQQWEADGLLDRLKSVVEKETNLKKT